MIPVVRGTNEDLIRIMQEFVRGIIDAQTFTTRYQDTWRLWRDSDERSRINDPDVASNLNQAFTAADCYKPQQIRFRLASDIDEAKLKSEIRQILEELDVP